MATGTQLLTKEVLPRFDEILEDLDVSNEELAALAGVIGERNLADGETLITVGDVSESIFIVKGGTLAVVLDNPAGAREVLLRIGVGNIVGEISSIAKTPATATVVAEGPASLFEINLDCLFNLRFQTPRLLYKLQMALCRVLAYRVQRTNRLVNELGRQQSSRH